ncbi:hypothetical protein CDL15_Pgr018047 [Punica granatum]|uniref:Uncharacterized protein n=1 Tax=Punica granatum TaxID=22663 RepID=A0A218WH37_PUNGR|nr:hypothetical protein CDL15_Pgr018047 [Punica granatum]PKI77919.1 hypothetical protein CRG98_001711 [Punica granatum]
MPSNKLKQPGIGYIPSPRRKGVSHFSNFQTDKMNVDSTAVGGRYAYGWMIISTNNALPSAGVAPLTPPYPFDIEKARGRLCQFGPQNQSMRPAAVCHNFTTWRIIRNGVVALTSSTVQI